MGTMGTASSGRYTNTGWRSPVPGTVCGDGANVAECWVRQMGFIRLGPTGLCCNERLRVDSVVCLSVLLYVGCTNGICVGILASRIRVTIPFAMC